MPSTQRNSLYPLQFRSRNKDRFHQHPGERCIPNRLFDEALVELEKVKRHLNRTVRQDRRDRESILTVLGKPGRRRVAQIVEPFK